MAGGDLYRVQPVRGLSKQRNWSPFWRQDSMPEADRIVVDPKILTGKPVVRGTRISVELVVELLAAGWRHAQILERYSHLSEEDIRACLAYASELLRGERVYPLKTA